MKSHSVTVAEGIVGELSKQHLRQFRRWAFSQQAVLDAFGPLVRLYRVAETLNASELSTLIARTRTRSRGQPSRRKKPSGREIIHTRMIRCGKPNCRCARGQLHGPYEYAYRSEQGKTATRYIGPAAPRTRPTEPR